MRPRLYIPEDSCALAVGADDVAEVAAAHGAEVWRTSSRGLFWLEPLIEVDTPEGRFGWGPCTAADLPAVLAGDRSHPKAVGLLAELPYLKNQQRLTFARAGLTRPLSLADYEAHGGGAGLRAARAMTPEAIVQAVTDSGLRGRGGAAFPAGIKWRTVAQTPGELKYVVCNGDEGDSGTYADRMLLEGDPFLLIEGMAIAARAVGAARGYVYARSEYPRSVEVFGRAIEVARAAGWLDGFDLEVRMGAGSYVCGEETAMLESLEGRRGVVRAKPPLPAIAGLFGRPTVINNLLTLAAVPTILAEGPAFYRDFGVGRSTGTMPFQLAGNLRFAGLVERAFGVTLRELLFDYGGGSASGRPIKAVQVGGPLGSYVPEAQWDVPLAYESYAAIGAVLGHGGLVVHDDRADMARLARYAMAFCAQESCGKCTPCRIGSTRGVEVIDKFLAGDARQEELLRDLCDTMVHGSLCAMGSMTPLPVLSALNHYPGDFRR
ncbi:formate dehydrogenase [Rubrivivax gelatinosus]|uniref:NADH-ubiquinone oxidoreductase-F iron-sulfur binding region domain-containing protein n=1 Tax=Rubrivivax gelatinosus TaxID=28068 RepID=UPI00190757DF|nr:NADH-ubiquinone oxidoreductase-F iron-sulfur binding region domain-containing protein [Rubrivivax gelatinosus]MBK1614265.1 formate dehydrogenase [Rubrivivax gelatinosus]